MVQPSVHSAVTTKAASLEHSRVSPQGGRSKAFWAKPGTGWDLIGRSEQRRRLLIIHFRRVYHPGNRNRYRSLLGPSKCPVCLNWRITFAQSKNRSKFFKCRWISLLRPSLRTYLESGVSGQPDCLPICADPEEILPVQNYPIGLMERSAKGCSESER